MDQPFVPVKDETAYGQLVEQSHQRPVVLFKHDPTCPISAAAHRELSHLSADVPLVDVLHQHDMAQAIADRTGVKHESPQVILLRNGQAVWSASLWDITEEVVNQVANEYAQA